MSQFLHTDKDNAKAIAIPQVLSKNSQANKNKEQHTGAYLWMQLLSLS